MAEYLVTGAAGFIGSAVANRLIELNHSVVTIDNLSTGYEQNIPINCEFIKGDIQNPDTLERLGSRFFDAIIHIAGQSSGEISFEDPIYDLQTNTQSTLLLLQYARNNNCKNFIYASTMSVYGDQDDPYVNEQTNAYPKSFYAVGKLASENYLRIFSEFGIQCTSLRLFNVYGIGQNMLNLKQGMLSIFINMAITEKLVKVKGSKDRFRDFINIDDVVNAFISSIDRKKGHSYEVYNISTGVKHSVEDLLRTIELKLPYDVAKEFLDGTPGDQFGIFGCNNKAKADLKWEPSVTFDAGIEQMIKWALSLKL